MRDVSAEGDYSRNLAFAQGIKGIGSTSSTYLVTAVTALALFKSMGWRGTFPLFFILMSLAFLGVLLVKVEETKADVPPSIGSSLGLLSQPIFLLAVVGIFLYVGAEVCMGTFLFPGLKDIGVDEKTASKFGPALFFLLLTIGRLLGGAVLTVMSARACFRLSALLGLLGAGAMMTGAPNLAIAGLLGAGAMMTGAPNLAIAGVFVAGLGFANIWPMLFSITVEERPQCASELSGLMCMAISGGAIVPLLMSKLVGPLKAMAFVVPAASFAYLFLLSLRGGGTPATAVPQPRQATNA
jgi:fucose permease